MPKSKVVSALQNVIPEPRTVIPTREHITRLLFETHKKCANSAEEVLTLKEIAKINDLSPKLNDSVVIDITAVVKTMEQLQGMNDAKLLEMMGDDDMFDMPEAIDAEFSEVEDDAS